MASTHPKSPPKARLAFRVGVVGHRPNRLPTDAAACSELREMIGFILARIRDEVEQYGASKAGRQWYAHEPPVLRAVSPLAEGCDRIFAEEAIARSYQILCPMPFHQPEYAKDFTGDAAQEPQSLQHFQALLAAADKTGLVKFELDGERSSEAEAYHMAGRVVLNQSDLLVAIWDGRPDAGEGGTLGSIREAVRFHVPVLWIDPFSPGQWQALRSADDLKSLRDGVDCRPRTAGYSSADEIRADLAQALAEIVESQIAGPNDAEAAEYFRKRKPAVNPGGLSWKLFRSLVAGEMPKRPLIAVPEFVEQVRREWPIASDPGLPQRPSKTEDWGNRELRPHFAWADGLAEVYADRYRSTYVEIYSLSVLSVAAALAPLTIGLPAIWVVRSIAAELVLLMLIVWRFFRERTRKWHDRWMEYRLLAELLRQLRLLVPLGGGCPFPNIPIVSTAWGSPTQTWMYWHMRAVGRAAGLPQARITPDHVRQSLQFVETVASGQLHFHAATAKRSERIAKTLHGVLAALFLGTIAAAVGRLLIKDLRLGEELVFLSAMLPVIGSALFAMLNQGEFVRLHKRSAGMVDLFHKFAMEIAVLQSDRVDTRLPDAAALARKIAGAMVDEVADWRVIFADRPVTI